MRECMTQKRKRVTFGVEKKRFTLRTSWYYILLFILTLKSAAEFSQVLNPLFSQVDIFLTSGTILLVFAVIFTAGRITKKQFFLLCIFGVLGVFLYLRMGRTLLFYLAIIFIYSKGKEPERICRVMLTAIVLVFAFNVLCTIYFALFDIGKLYVRISLYEPRPQIDFSCGGHPNHAAGFIDFIVIMISYLNWEKLTVIKWVFLLAGTAAIYLVIGSEALAAIPLLFALWLLRKNETAACILKRLVKYGIFVMLTVSLIYLWVSYIPVLRGAADWLNEISSGRFELSMNVLDLYAPTLFGANTEFGHIATSPFADEYVYADNAYVYMIVNLGIIYLAVIELILFFSEKRLDYKALALVAVFLFYGLAESYIISFITIFPLLNAMNQYLNKNSTALKRLDDKTNKAMRYAG